MAMEPSLERRGGVANAPLPSVIFSHLSMGVQLAEIERTGWRRRGCPVATYRSSFHVPVAPDIRCQVGAL
jgi:hypothetical protein